MRIEATRPRHRGMMALCAILVCLAVAWALAAPRMVPLVTITVAPAPPGPVPSRAGLLLGPYPPGRPPQSLLLALRPGMIRVRDWQLYDRTRAAGASTEFVLSELWGYPQNNYGGRGVPPYDDLDRWGGIVRGAARAGAGRAMLRWDVWNESNWPKFFVGSQQQFFAVYLRAYTVLRQELGPEAIIGGPSLAIFDLGFLRNFLAFCAAHGCEVNFLSWHEATEPPGDPEIISAHARAARALAAQPAFRAAGVRQIEINETVGPHDQYFPASALADLVALEQGGADLGARACWTDREGRSNCFNNSLDGLVQPGGEHPLAVWWLYKYYADSLASRLAARADAPRIAVIASRPDARTTQLLIGYYRGGGDQDRKAVISLAGGARLGPRVRVEVRVIPVAYEAPMDALPTVAADMADPARPIAIPDLHVNEVAVVTVTAP